MLKKLKSDLEQFSERPADELNDKEIESKVDLIESIKNLEKEIVLIKNEVRNSYILNTSHLLYEYFDENRIFTKSDNCKVNNSKKDCIRFLVHQKSLKPKITEEVRAEEVSKYSSKNEIMDQYLQFN